MWDKHAVFRMNFILVLKYNFNIVLKYYSKHLLVSEKNRPVRSRLFLPRPLCNFYNA